MCITPSVFFARPSPCACTGGDQGDEGHGEAREARRGAAEGPVRAGRAEAHVPGDHRYGRESRDAGGSVGTGKDIVEQCGAQKKKSRGTHPGKKGESLKSQEER